jgi:hypothetical protein
VQVKLNQLRGLADEAELSTDNYEFEDGLVMILYIFPKYTCELCQLLKFSMALLLLMNLLLDLLNPFLKGEF